MTCSAPRVALRPVSRDAGYSWTQRCDDSDELALVIYQVFVDGTLSDSVACSTLGPVDRVRCSSILNEVVASVKCD